MPNIMNMAGRGKYLKHLEAKRIELVFTSDPYTELKPGDRGTVSLVDDIGTVHVNWDSGSKLGLCPGEDQYRIIG